MDNDTLKKRFDMRPVWGVIIILIGVVLLLNELGVNINLGDFWPIFLAVPGLGFWLLYFSKRHQRGIEGVLIPGTILLGLGAFFFFQSFTDWKYEGDTGFVYTLIISLAFFAPYLLGERNRGYLVPAWILLAVSLIIFFATIVDWTVWPVFLIVFGVWLLFRPKKSDHKNNQEETPSKNK
ncbi:MAG: hypothetical protein PHH01_04030 [Patescibacteria group bacterium]|nr:hypothetical protein [Patescibacteria group bacterium]